jgi:hypothetical protein
VVARIVVDWGSAHQSAKTEKKIKANAEKQRSQRFAEKGAGKGGLTTEGTEITERAE